MANGKRSKQQLLDDRVEKLRGSVADLSGLIDMLQERITAHPEWSAVASTLPEIRERLSRIIAAVEGARTLEALIERYEEIETLSSEILGWVEIGHAAIERAEAGTQVN